MKQTPQNEEKFTQVGKDTMRSITRCELRHNLVNNQFS